MTDETKSAIEDFNKEQIRVRMDLAEEAKGYSWRPNSAKLIVEPGTELAYIPGTVTIAEHGCGFSVSGPLHKAVHESYDNHICYYPVTPPTTAQSVCDMIYRVAWVAAMLTGAAFLASLILPYVSPLWMK